MVLLEFSMYPLGKGESVGAYVARCLKTVEQSGLDYECHATGTIIEADKLDQALDVVRRCFADLAADCDRIECEMKLDYRKGYKGELKSRVPRVEQRLGELVKR